MTTNFSVNVKNMQFDIKASYVCGHFLCNFWENVYIFTADFAVFSWNTNLTWDGLVFKYSTDVDCVSTARLSVYRLTPYSRGLPYSRVSCR